MVEHRVDQCHDQKTRKRQKEVQLQYLRHAVEPHGVCGGRHKGDHQIDRMLHKHTKPKHNRKVKEVQKRMTSRKRISHNIDPPHPCQVRRCNAIPPHRRPLRYISSIRSSDTSCLHSTSIRNPCHSQTHTGC